MELLSAHRIKWTDGIGLKLPKLHSLTINYFDSRIPTGLCNLTIIHGLWNKDIEQLKKVKYAKNLHISIEYQKKTVLDHMYNVILNGTFFIVNN